MDQAWQVCGVFFVKYDESTFGATTRLGRDAHQPAATELMKIITKNMMAHLTLDKKNTAISCRSYRVFQRIMIDGRGKNTHFSVVKSIAYPYGKQKSNHLQNCSVCITKV